MVLFIYGIVFTFEFTPNSNTFCINGKACSEIKYNLSEYNIYYQNRY